MLSRRAFLRTTGVLGATAATFDIDPILAATDAVADRPAADVAQDEFYWREIQQAYSLDRP